MTRKEEIQIELKEAEINYSAVWRISNEVFTKKASEVLDVPIERVQVHRNVIEGTDWGTLHVIVYKVDDEEKLYYRLNNGGKHYKKLPPNIYEFERALVEKVTLTP